MIFSFAAYGVAGVGAMKAVERLIPGLRRDDGFPYDALLREANYWVFLFFTLCMLIGGVWAFLAWGSYWAWNTKGIFSGALWLFYAAAVHLPYQGKWRRGLVTGVSIAGFLLVLVTFLGVGMLMRSNHPLQ